MPRSSSDSDALAARTVGISRIPVRNLWLLQLFASHLYRSGASCLTGAEQAPEDLPDAVATLLVHEVENRMRQSLSTGFRRRHDVIHRVRGRIDVLDTYRHRRLDRAQVSCRFDEIVVDTPANRIVRAALGRAARIVRDPDIARHCRSLDERLRAYGVSAIGHPQIPVRTLLIDRNLVRDRQMISAADLLLNLLIPSPDDGRAPARDVSDEDAYLRNLFEWAVYGFYRARLRPERWTVRHGRWIDFDFTDPSDGITEILPRMQLDIELTSPNHRHIIIDTKFTSVTRSNNYSRQRLKSEYIYQIYAYVRSQERHHPDGQAPAEGLMLHPSVGLHVDEELTIQGHRIRFATIDLSADTESIIRELLSAISPANEPGSPTLRHISISNASTNASRSRFSAPRLSIPGREGDGP